MKNNTIDARLLNARVAIENTLSNKVILDALSVYGYSNKRFKEGLSLLEDAETKHTNQKREYGEQFSATDALEAAIALTNSVYMRHVKIARVALRDQRGSWQTLQINGRRQKSYSGWIKQATVFYSNAVNDKGILTQLTKFGITEEILNNGLVAVQDVEKKLAQQLREMGEAQEATAIRDEAFDKIEDWISDFIAVSRVALEENPQMLETIGVVEPHE